MNAKVSGFTLIEILVVMSLLSVIMVAMAGALRTMAQTETRVDERLGRNDQMRVATGFLRKTLGRIDVAKGDNRSGPGGQRIQFAAEASSISWVGIMPARYGAGGRYFFRLASEETTDGQALVLRYTPWVPQSGFPEWNQAQSHVLASGITKFLVEAEGLPLEVQSTPSTWPRGWQSGWPVAEATPQRLRLTLADMKGPWPPLVIAILPTTQSQSGPGGFVIGGSGG